MDKITYLAIPYAHNPDLSFAIANEIAAQLMLDGKTVFSPVSQGHGISDYLEPEFRDSSNFWLRQDLPILKLCSEMIIVVIGEDGRQLINDSVGCQAEIRCAMDNGLPITWYEYKLDYTDDKIFVCVN